MRLPLPIARRWAYIVEFDPELREGLEQSVRRAQPKGLRVSSFAAASQFVEAFGKQRLGRHDLVLLFAAYEFVPYLAERCAGAMRGGQLHLFELAREEQLGHPQPRVLPKDDDLRARVEGIVLLLAGRHSLALRRRRARWSVALWLVALVAVVVRLGLRAMA
ncbi:MAG: hypothetical protein IJU72_00825 [Bacteroidales bacterium]|nr:hypothetical protein [Bacteroidales bacterium]